MPPTPTHQDHGQTSQHCPVESGAQLQLADALARLVRDYEARIDVADDMIYVAMGFIMLRRLTT